MSKSLSSRAIALSCLFLLGLLSGILLLRFAQHKGESREVSALRFELRKYGAVKGYSDSDREFVDCNAEYCFVDPELAWAVAKAENARAVAFGGILSTISWEIRMRAAEREWPHWQMVKGIQFYQMRFVKNHPMWWAKHCKKYKGGKTTKVWREFFWTYRTQFVRELSYGWVAERENRPAWRKNVLILWAKGRG